MILITISPEGTSFAELCFKALGDIENAGKILGIEFEDMSKDGSDAIVIADWSVDDEGLRENFDSWCMKHFNRYAEYHKVKGEDL